MTAPTRTRVIVLLTAIALSLVLLLAVAVAAQADDAQPGGRETTLVEHAVQRGDTLWDIAAQHVTPGDDVRVLIEDIKDVNDLVSSVIVPGQLLRIPIGG